MTARLDRPLRRELMIGGHAYVLTVSPKGLKLVLKGKRKGYELDWKSLVSGDAALAAAMTAMLANAPPPPTAPDWNSEGKKLKEHSAKAPPRKHASTGPKPT